MQPPHGAAERFTWATALIATGAAIGAVATKASGQPKRGAVAGALVAGLVGSFVAHLDGPQWDEFGQAVALETLAVGTMVTVVGLLAPMPSNAKASLPTP